MRLKLILSLSLRRATQKSGRAYGNGRAGNIKEAGGEEGRQGPGRMSTPWLLLY
jgi:hypothetical protein